MGQMIIIAGGIVLAAVVLRYWYIFLAIAVLLASLLVVAAAAVIGYRTYGSAIMAIVAGVGTCVLVGSGLAAVVGRIDAILWRREMALLRRSEETPRDGA